ncbi:MAG: hypothetical protein ABIP74_03425 [Candidatus Saccharimonas sp.]
MNEEQTPYTVMLEPKLQSRTLDNWTPKDSLVAALIGLATVAVFVWTFNWSSGAALFLSIFTLLVLWSLLTRRKVGWGRGYEEIGQAYRTHVLKKRKGVWWQASDNEVGASKPRLFAPPPVIPLKLNIIPAVTAGRVHRIPVLSHLDKPYDQLIIRVKGGVFGALDGRELYEAHEELTRVCNIALSSTKLQAGIAFQYVSAPIHEHDFVDEMRRKGSPIWRFPEQFDLDDQQREFADMQAEYASQLIPTFQAAGATENWSLIVITIKRTSKSRAAEQGKLDHNALYNLPVLKLGRELVEMLSTSPRLGFSDAHILKPHELFLLIRLSWDVVGIQDFYTTYYDLVDRYEGLKKKLVQEFEQLTEDPETDTDDLETRLADLDRQMLNELTEITSCWPSSIISEDDEVIRMNDNYISVLRVDETPEFVVDSEYLSQLEEIPFGHWIRRFIGGESISGSKETYAIMGKQATTAQVEGLLSEKLIVSHPKMRRLQERLANQADLVSNHSIAQLFGEYWAVVADSSEACTEQRGKLSSRLSARGFMTRVVDVPALHVDAVLTATLGTFRM